MPDLKIGISVVGDEILSGHVQDTNTHWLLNQLRRMHYEVQRVETVPDDVQLIANSVQRFLAEKFDVIFVTGGLGPTPHDMTTEGIACALNVKCIPNDEAMVLIQQQYERFRKMGILKATSEQDVTAAEKMSRLPPACTLLPPIGTAPGFHCKVKTTGEHYCKIFVLPGPPLEYQAMFNAHIKNKLLPKNQVDVENLEIVTRTEEARLVPVLKQVIHDFPHLKVASYPNIEELHVLIRLTGKRDDTLRAAEIIQQVLKELGPG